MTILIFKKGEKHTLTEKQKDKMKVFQESEAISSKVNNQMKIELFEYSQFLHMVKYLELAEQISYGFDNYPPIRTKNLSDYIPQRIAKQLQKMNEAQLNNLYKIAHFFICEGVRKIVVAAFACRIFFQPTLAGYLETKNNMGIKKDLTQESRNIMKERFPFMN